MNKMLQASSSHWALKSLAPLLVALVIAACGSEDNSNDSGTGAGGAPTTGDPMVDTGGAGGTTSATTSPNSTSGAGPNTTNSTTPNFGTTTTGTGGAETSTSGMNTGMTGFGGGSVGPGFGFGGQGADATTASGTGGSGGSDVSPGETGVFEGTIAAHNAARADVDATPPLPEMVWSDELAEIAQDWANNLVSDENCGNISHRPNNDYGENIALQGSTGISDPFTGPDAVASWVAEIDCYTYGTIGQTEQCDPGCIADLNSNGCGHYTQVVWDATTAVGCGYGTCEDGNFTIEVIVCNYDPPGNYIGQTPY